jgi:dTMP kinase
VADTNRVFINFEGIDGSGKTTQFKLLQERLQAAGYDIEVFDFPQYDKPSSHFVRKYLNGEYGPAAEISPYTASLFFALDRYESAADIKRALEQGKIVLANRYVAANMAHQGSKLINPADQRGFFVWEDSLEFQLLGIPRPTLNIFLRVSAEVSKKLIDDRAKERGMQLDEHEKDTDHLRKTVAAYDVLCKLFPKDFAVIESTAKGKMLNVKDVNDRIWQLIKPLLPTVHHRISETPTLKMEKTNTVNAPEVLKKSNQELAGYEIFLEIDNISLLAAAEIELNQSLQVSIERAWKKSQEFYTPTNLPAEISKQYDSYMLEISDNYQAMNTKVDNYFKNHAAGPDSKLQTKKAIDLAIPMAALTSIKIGGSKTNIKSLIDDLRTHSLEEIRLIAVRLQDQAHQTDPEIFSKEIDKGDNSKPEQLKETIARIAQTHFPQLLSDSSEEVSLLHTSPRNEFELIVAGVYSHTTLAPEKIIAEIESWPYGQKKETLTTLIRESWREILPQARYRLDLVSDRVTLQEMIEDKVIEDVKIQQPTPRFGYNVAQVIEEIGADDLYMECFDSSLTLFSVVQEAGKEEVGGYCTLQGHKIRAQFTVSASSLVTPNRRKGYALLMNQIKEKVAENHPLIAAELTKLASEPAKHSKSGRRKKRSKKS